MLMQLLFMFKADKLLVGCARLFVTIQFLKSEIWEGFVMYADPAI